MIDHIGIDVSDLAKSVAFYKRALSPLGYELVAEFEGFAGFGVGRKPDFWLQQSESGMPHLHVAFRSENRASVSAFHEAALAAGATDHGAPGIRAIYHPTYFGAFVLDRDGHNIEAVCHAHQ